MARRRRWALTVAVLLVVGTAGAGVTLWLQGYRAYVVHTGSMEPNYLPGDLVIDRAPSGSYHRGEVITFRHSARTDDLVTHRVTGVTAAGLIHTKGDANATADVWEIRPDQVQGDAALRVRGAGYLVVFFRQPAGVAALATALLALILLWRLFFAAPPRPPTPEPATRALSDPRRRRPRPSSA